MSRAASPPARHAKLAAVLAASLVVALPARALGDAQQRGLGSPATADPRLRELPYDPDSVVTVPVKRGMVTLVLLGADEAIVEVAAGLGGDCAKPESAWCIAAQAGGRTVFVKPKSSAEAANNLVIVSSRRIHNLRLQLLADQDPRPALHRLTIKAPPNEPAASQIPALPPQAISAALQAKLFAQLQASIPPQPSAEQRVAERLLARPVVKNSSYSLAEGRASQDIVPTLVFDDGRFTYLRLPGNREMPAVFQVLGDGSEALVNTRMEEDLLVVDRVSRRLVLRAGAAVVGIWNEAFDLEGVPPQQGTTVAGVRRHLRGAPATLPTAVPRAGSTDTPDRDKSPSDGVAP